MNEDEYLYKITNSIFNIKSNVEQTGFAIPKVVEELLAMRMNDILHIEKLNKQLEYALQTGGEYLEIENHYN